MAYNNGFPATYPQYYPQYPQQMQQQASQQPTGNNPFIWVCGETGAKSYLVSPGCTVPLWDSEAPTIYVKSADSFGMPSISILDYTIRGARPANAPYASTNQVVQYATHDDIKNVSDRLDYIQSVLEGLTAKPPVSTGKNKSKESAENE